MPPEVDEADKRSLKVAVTRAKEDCSSETAPLHIQFCFLDKERPSISYSHPIHSIMGDISSDLSHLLHGAR